MKQFFTLLLAVTLTTSLWSQSDDTVIQKMITEATENSQLENLAHQLMDGIGPRLVGSPGMKNAHDWAVNTFEDWGVSARNEKWGEWRGWERGITHIDMVSPRVQSLRGTQLAWNPSTKKDGVTAEVVTLPTVKDSMAFVIFPVSNIA